MHIDLERALKSGIEKTRTTQSGTHTHAIDLANSLEVSTRSERCEKRSIETPLPADPEGWIQIRFWNKFDTVSTRAIQQKQPDRKIFNLFTTLIAGPKEESR